MIGGKPLHTAAVRSVFNGRATGDRFGEALVSCALCAREQSSDWLHALCGTKLTVLFPGAPHCRFSANQQLLLALLTFFFAAPMSDVELLFTVLWHEAWGHLAMSRKHGALTVAKAVPIIVQRLAIIAHGLPAASRALLQHWKGNLVRFRDGLILPPV